MTPEKQLHARAESKCELCAATEALAGYCVPPRETNSADDSVLICPTCRAQIEAEASIDLNHWRCLNDSMWSAFPAVQVLAWRMLNRLEKNGAHWAQDALENMYLENETLAWAKQVGEGKNEESTLKHVDSHGAMLAAGDTVTLTKDLNVKGTSFTVKRGTAVRGISLVSDNEKHIEGRINGQQIVILTAFVKKT